MRQTQLSKGEIIYSPTSGLRYRIIRPIGAGGFGTAYLARRTKSHPHIPPTVCLKMTTHLQSWISESYFGYLLKGVHEAISVYDVFVDPARQGLFAVVSEYATHGDLARYLRRHPVPWKPSRVCREVARILRVLDVLHRGQALHRDLTPFNVFVCQGPHLKLGDFGIARHYARRDGLAANTMAPWMAPREIAEGAVRNWRARDDVYQVGQLLGMLLQGQEEEPITSREIPALHCSDELKEIVQRCIGPRAKRFDTAADLIAKLKQPRRKLREARIRSLDGKVVVFTGRLDISRQRATMLAVRAGATVAGKVSGYTDVVIRGKRNPLQVAGDRGQKLIDVAMWRERGKNMRVIAETQFLELVKST